MDMYYQQALKPNELLPALSDSEECFFVLRATLPNRNYQIAIYRYDDEYFLLQDERLFNQIYTISHERLGDEEQILPFIEEALENNHYFLVQEEFIRLDLTTLQKMKLSQSFEILFYEFYDL
jgi:hypothetical protein